MGKLIRVNFKTGAKNYSPLAKQTRLVPRLAKIIVERYLDSDGYDGIDYIINDLIPETRTNHDLFDKYYTKCQKAVNIQKKRELT